MKRYGNLFEKIVTIENIKLAHMNARRGKRKYKDVIEIDKDIDGYCNKIQELLVSGNFVCTEYDMFIKNDKGKKREIYRVPYFPDRIIQHAIMQIVEPIWKKSLITDTYQAIKGRGVHKCMYKMRKAVQVDKLQYCMQIDVKKFYPSINNELLKIVVRKKIKCKKTLMLIDAIIDGIEGVPIGNYISQYFGNLFLSALDHLLKEEYKAKHYFRYCDDIIILSNDKEYLHNLLKVINIWLGEHKLALKHNYQVYKISSSRGVDCFGYVLFSNKTSLRKSIATSFKKACKTENLPAIPAYFGWMLPCSNDALWNMYIPKCNNVLYTKSMIKLNNKLKGNRYAS
jgi:RNA-directed DNA polymerase